MNTYSDQRNDVSVFGAGFTDDNMHGRLCNLSGDHVSGDLDTIASGSCGGCDGIARGGRVCSVCNVDHDRGIVSGIRAFDGRCFNDVRTARNAAINVDVSALLVSLVDDGLCGGAAFAFL